MKIQNIITSKISQTKFWSMVSFRKVVRQNMINFNKLWQHQCLYLKLFQKQALPVFSIPFKDIARS